MIKYIYQKRRNHSRTMANFGIIYRNSRMNGATFSWFWKRGRFLALVMFGSILFPWFFLFHSNHINKAGNSFPVCIAKTNKSIWLHVKQYDECNSCLSNARGRKKLWIYDVRFVSHPTRRRIHTKHSEKRLMLNGKLKMTQIYNGKSEKSTT